MRRITALMVSIVLLLKSTNVETIFADILKMPASLIEIESQAFYGDTSLSVVEIPYGTEYIKSKAFAYSSVEKIYIPSTVNYIAANAFDGVPDVIIYAPEGSYAQEFAEGNDFLWLDIGNTYISDELEELLISFDDIDSIDPFDIESYDFIPLVLQESMSQEEKDDIVKYNLLCETMEEDANEFIELIYDLSYLTNDLSNELDSYNMDVSVNSIALDGEGFNYQVEGDQIENLGSDYSVQSVLASENGEKISVEIESNGQIFYLEADGQGISLTGTPVISQDYLEEVSASSLFDGYDPKSVFDNLLDKLSSFSTLISLYDVKIDEAVISAAKNEESAAAGLELVKIMAKRDPTNPIYSKEIKKGQDKYDAAAGNLRKAKNLSKIVKPICKALSLKSLITSYNHVKELLEILDHEHPNATEASNAASVMLIKKMKEDIVTSISAYICDALNTGLTYLSSVSAALVPVALFFPASAPVILGQRALAMAAITTVRALLFNIFGGVILSSIADAKYYDATEADKTLHGVIAGKVTDEDTGLPIKNVAVTCGEVTVYTNSSGFYSVKSKNGANTLEFWKHGYNKKTVLVNASSQMSTPYNERLNARGIITGTVVDAVSGNPIGGVTVLYGYYQTTTNNSGKYQINAPIGTEELSFTKEDYIPIKYENVVSALNTTTKKDAVMTKKLKENQYRAVLSWGASPADLDAHLNGPNYHVYYSSKTGTNAVLDIDDTSSYGPETITFTVSNQGTYSYFVHDYTNRNNSSSRALAGSGAVVRVYNGDSMVGEYHVPNITGTTWNVFSIVNGVYKANYN